MSPLNHIGELILKHVLSRLPTRLIYAATAEPYMVRYYVAGRPPKTTSRFECFFPRLAWLPFTIYIHWFLKADDDERWPHNHPSAWAVSLILNGGYTEERPGKKLRTLRRGSINWISHSTFHRVASLLSDNTFTLFVVGKTVSDWGFLRPDGTVKPAG